MPVSGAAIQTGSVRGDQSSEPSPTAVNRTSSQSDRDGRRDGIEREHEHDAQRDGRGDLRHRVDGRERQVGADGGDAHRRSPCCRRRAAAPHPARGGGRRSRRRTRSSWVTATTPTPSSRSPTMRRRELPPGRGVLPERGLVEHEHARSGRDRGRHREAPLLAARERERVRLREPVEPQHGEQLVDARAAFADAELERAGPDLELGAHRAGEELVLGALEHRADAREQVA